MEASGEELCGDSKNPGSSEPTLWISNGGNEKKSEGKKVTIGKQILQGSAPARVAELISAVEKG